MEGLKKRKATFYSVLPPSCERKTTLRLPRTTASIAVASPGVLLLDRSTRLALPVAPRSILCDCATEDVNSVDQGCQRRIHVSLYQLLPSFSPPTFLFDNLIKMQVFSLMSWTPFIFTFSWNDCSNSIFFHTRCGTAKLVWYLLSVGLLDQKCKYLIFLAVCLPWYLWKMEVHGLFLYSKKNEN